MKVGIDTSHLMYQGSGVATYTYHLVRNLLCIDKKNEYHIFYSSLRRPHKFTALTEFQKLGAHVHSFRFPPRVFTLLWKRFHLFPVEWLIGKVDIFHSSDYVRPPLLPGTKGITTIHDLTWKIYPHAHTPDIILAHNSKLKKTIKYHDTILTDAQKTVEDIRIYYPKIKNKIYTVPLGVDDIFFIKQSSHKIKGILKKYRIKQPYILYVGAIEPRKNIPTLVRSFAAVFKKYPNLELVIAGRAGWKNEEVFATIKKLKMENKVRFTGYVEDTDLPSLYQGAKLCVYPSSYEGFGLPPLESLASRTPVVAYNSPSISNVFHKHITPSQLARDITQQLARPKKIKVKILRWKEVAKKTLEVYKKTVGNRFKIKREDTRHTKVVSSK